MSDRYSMTECRANLAGLRSRARVAGELARRREWSDVADLVREIESQASAIAATIERVYLGGD